MNKGIYLCKLICVVKSWFNIFVIIWNKMLITSLLSIFFFFILQHKNLYVDVCNAVVMHVYIQCFKRKHILEYFIYSYYTWTHYKKKARKETMTEISILLKMNSSAKKSFKERMNNENSLLKYFSVSMGYTKYFAYFDLISPQ